MKKLVFLLFSLFSVTGFAGNQDLIKCTFLIKDNDTSVDLLEKSKYTTSFELHNGQDYKEEIKIRRLLTIPREDHEYLQRKLAYKDVIFLFEKDQREKRVRLYDNKLEGTVSTNTLSSKVILKANRIGASVSFKFIDSTDRLNEHILRGYGYRNQPPRFKTDGINAPRNKTYYTASQKLKLKVKYKVYETPVFGANKMKTKTKYIPIDYHCVKTKGGRINNSELSKDVQEQDDALNDFYRAGARHR